jgi:tetratricopeptide (TPR) repeat protein
MLHLASLCTLLLGMLTKEFTFTAPFTLVAMELYLFCSGWRETLRQLMWHLACLVVIPAILLTLSHDLAGTGGSVFSATAIANFNGYSHSDYALTQLRVVLSYFRLLVLPYGLNFDPDYPLFQSPAHPEILLSLLIWLGFATVALRMFRQRGNDIAADLAGFSIIWFPMLLCVSSSVVPLPDLMSEHRTYLPSLAFCTGMVAYLFAICNSSSAAWHRRFVITGCIALAVFSLLTVQRNQVYSSRLSLWGDSAAKSPNKARPALAIGTIYQEMQQNELAIAWLKKSIQLDPDYREPYLSLGSLYQDLGRHPEAIGLYETYLETHPPGRRILSNLALAYSRIGMSGEAIACLKSALQIDPDDEQLHIITAEQLFLAGRSAEANEYIVTARELDRLNPLADYSGTINMVEKFYGSNGMSHEKHNGKVSS